MQTHCKLAHLRMLGNFPTTSSRAESDLKRFRAFRQFPSAALSCRDFPNSNRDFPTRHAKRSQASGGRAQHRDFPRWLHQDKTPLFSSFTFSSLQPPPHHLHRPRRRRRPSPTALTSVVAATYNIKVQSLSCRYPNTFCDTTDVVLSSHPHLRQPTWSSLRTHPVKSPYDRYRIAYVSQRGARSAVFRGSPLTDVDQSKSLVYHFPFGRTKDSFTSDRRENDPTSLHLGPQRSCRSSSNSSSTSSGRCSPPMESGATLRTVPSSLRQPSYESSCMQPSCISLPASSTRCCLSVHPQSAGSSRCRTLPPTAGECT